MVVPLSLAMERGFPGPKLAGFCFILGPALLLAASVLLMPFVGGTFEERQTALAAEPTRALLALELYTAGWMAILIAIFPLASMVRLRHPRIGLAAGLLAVAGVSVSLFFSGVQGYEIGMASIADREAAASVEAGSAAPFVIFASAPGIALGWILMAWGCYRSQILGPIRSLAMAAIALTPVVVIGGFPVFLSVPFLGMAVALVPLGVALLRTSPAGSVSGAVQA